MKLNHIISTAALALLPLAASAATIVIPVAGSADGANASRWESDLTLHNTSARTIPILLRYHTGNTSSAPIAIQLQHRTTRTLQEIVLRNFLRFGTVGAVTIEVSDADASRLAVTSRSYNVAADGSKFGQDIAATRAEDAAVAGQTAVLTGPGSVAEERFNFGLFALEATTVRWELLRENGTVVVTKEASYAAHQHVQYNQGVASFFGAPAQDDDVVYATILSGRAVAYGSAVNARTGDPSFVPALLTSEFAAITLHGIDVDEDGTVDIGDANGDGVLDAPLEATTSMFPSYFRLIASGENGGEPTFEILSSPAGGAFLLDTHGTIQLGAPGDLRGQTHLLKVRATVDGYTTTFTIPVLFK
jgi:hypothetical protein